MIATQHVLPAGAGERADFGTMRNRFVVRGDQTAGALAVVEHELAPRTLGAPMHVHEREDEISFVLAGRLGVQIGDDVLEAGPGDTVFKPRGVPHAFWNAGDEPLRLLEHITPAGFEQYFAELAPLLDGDGPPDFAALAALQARYALTMDMESLPRLMAQHRLR